MKTILIIIGIVAVLLVGGSLWSRSLQSNDPNTLSTSGLHWHPHLTIVVKGERVPIPSNIGVGPQHRGMPTFEPQMGMTAMHTHDETGIIHLEFPGRVRKQDLKLGNFFQIWGKDFNEFGSSVTMTVNGKENAELENYEMKDGDKIEIRYE